VSLLNESPMIKDVAFSYQNIVSDGWRTSNDYEVIGEDRKIRMDLQEVTPNFLEVMGIGITEGRNFESHDMQNPQGAVIYPEFAKRKYDLTMETRMNLSSQTGGDTRLVGFCEDVKMQPLQKTTRPTAFYVSGRDPRFFVAYIRTTENADLDVLKTHVESSFAKLDPQVKPEQLKIQSIDEQLGREYEKEKELTRLITVFSLISILIALMGVFGLVFFETQYRRREIAVRRVHGAQISQVLGMFVGQYVKMVLIAFLFAAPVSYLIMSRWLEGFAYHIPLYWWVFLIALAIVLAVTSAIVVARAYRAAKEDPVNALYKE
jgi:putative ABC transport system permease protein